MLSHTASHRRSVGFGAIVSTAHNPPFSNQGMLDVSFTLTPGNKMSAHGLFFFGPGGFIQNPYLLGGSSSTTHCADVEDEEDAVVCYEEDAVVCSAPL